MRFARADDLAEHAALEAQLELGPRTPPSLRLADAGRIGQKLLTAFAQQGETQAIGGANHKIEGFFRACSEAGLTGKQGGLIPQANEKNLSIRPDVADAIAAGKIGRAHV